MNVGDLLGLPGAHARALAGEQGLGRRVAWAHAMEFAHPHEWLARDELVMTSGLNLPAGARAQRKYIDNLEGVGAAAMVILDDRRGPPLTNELLARADELGFPVLEVTSPAAFPAIAKAVAEAGRGAAADALLAAEQMYNALRAATVANVAGGCLIADVAASHGCTAAVLDRATGRVLLRDPDRPVAPALIAQAAAAVRVEREIPAHAIRVRDGDDHGLAVSLALAGGALLLVGHQPADDPDPIAMHHLATIATAEHERLLVARRRDQDRGADLLAAAMDEAKPPEILAVELAASGIAGPYEVAALDPVPGDPGLRALYFALAEEGIAALTRVGPDRCYVLVSADGGALRGLLSLVSETSRVGVSAPVADPERVAHATQQARWTLNLARQGGERVVRHVDERLAAFVPESLDDAQGIVDALLGRLIAYDAEKEVDLLHSLRTFLEENRSWQRASARLFVHKQTLVYRMRKVEELTRLRLDDTEDVTQLWLALRTRDMLG
ncbi:MAG TPA: PucR family transcriptional regulator ligand-binding domain-containing protein [Baekduia sp.]|uniref:PucR family transcriptional regulator n=1 Tax=Baekduia sp. TaxID=2600305 RepID=UPI002D77D6C3|nr:PucR family transcriptional regulator ligand-binding domain-containing protein [Baekduia sp.]HET6509089.1 PucR family transcriptional regulator ligand-binding domain-containing protein [Baekduia sp.]